MNSVYSNEEEYYETVIKPQVDNELLIHMAFFSPLTLQEAIIVWERLRSKFDEDIPEVSDTALVLLTTDLLETNYCIKAGKYFDDHETEEYGREKAEQYMEFLIMDLPIETAYEEANMRLYTKDFEEMDFHNEIDPFGDFDPIADIPYAYENDEEDYNASWKDDFDEYMYGDSGDAFGADDYSEDSFA